jgi:uncharacterized cofD-like protein
MTTGPDCPQKRLVFIGGGTGLSVLLKGVKKYTNQITAIVTVSDDGGSSGILRQELGILATGDIRNCLVALAETESLMEQLFRHRFSYGSTMQGHSLGNLLLAGMTEITGDFASAIRKISEVLAIRGKVLPSTVDNVHLGAIMEDKSLVYGETAIREQAGKIEQVFLVPGNCAPVPEALDSIRRADVIVLGPGSLYTSILPNLLVGDLKRALIAAPGKKAYICNIMTEHGETDCFTAADHVRALYRYVGEGFLQSVVVNLAPVDTSRRARYQLEAAQPVDPCVEELTRMGLEVKAEDLLAPSSLAWHDSDKLARLILEL